MRGYVSFILLFLLSFLLLSPLLMRVPFPNLSSAYESDLLYYALSSYKRALADSAFDSAQKAAAAYAASSAAGAALPCRLDQCAENAAAFSFISTTNEFNSNWDGYEFGISCGANSPAGDAVSSSGSAFSPLQCNESLSYAAPGDSASLQTLAVSGPIRVYVKNKQTGKAANGELPLYLSLGGRL